jgi:hypothetical protein
MVSTNPISFFLAGDTIDENKFLSMGGHPFDATVDPAKFGFEQRGNAYSLVIRNCQLKDAGGVGGSNGVGYPKG